MPLMRDLELTLTGKAPGGFRAFLVESWWCSTCEDGKEMEIGPAGEVPGRYDIVCKRCRGVVATFKVRM